MVKDSTKPRALAQQIHEALKARGSGSRQGHRPSAQSDFGVYRDDFQAVLRQFKKPLKNEDPDFLYRLSDDLVSLENTECRRMAYELLYGLPHSFQSLNKARVEFLGRGLDNWACVDNFSLNIAGPAWRRGSLEDKTLVSWSQSDDQWWRRAAVVATIPLNLKSRGGTGDVARTLLICEKVVEDKSLMVQKALSWALRALVPIQRASVEDVLKRYESKLTALVKRELKKKLRTGKKQ
ncbi:MAG: DNA alkylation repair protein [Planctomycetota bacterium]|nr:DNA alkylation repair protein [Planctomycetota bacterium]